MSVIIKGMDMPMCCGRCDFNVSSLYCNRTGSEIDRDYEYRGRLSDCPISELPEKHGRLKDVDAIIEDIRKNSESYFADDFAREWIDRQPTIVEAEGD